jgi:sulfatase maturation enzyme AslB (radical SAM superfamily)
MRHAVDRLEEYFPSLSVMIRRSWIEFQTLSRTFKPWKPKESQCPGLMIQTTNICNANCIFCAYQYQDRFTPTTGMMSDELYAKTLKEYKDLGGELITFTALVGDPLVDPRFLARFRQAKDAGFQVGVITNGILLNKLDLDELFAIAPIFFCLSTAPFEAETYEKIYRSNRYSQLLQGIERLLKRRNELNASFLLSLHFRSHVPASKVKAYPDFKNRIAPLMTEAEHKSVFTIMNGFDSWGGMIEQGDLLQGMKLAKPARIRHRPCNRTFELMVQWDGAVRACSCRYTGKERSNGIDELCVGDMSKSTLKEIWDGPEIRALRQRFVDNNLPAVCSNCAVYRPC